MPSVEQRIGLGEARAQDRLVNPFPLQLSRRPMAPPRLLGGLVVVVLAVVLSIWLLVAAGVQRNQVDGGSLPQPLPAAPSLVQLDTSAPGVEVGPVPGADIAPMEGTLSPR